MYMQSLKTFLQTPSKKPKLVVIYGPTGSGKTAMSIEIAQALESEIISVDSRQIFRQMDIGTGKILPEQMQGIPHHMIDIIDPDTSFSLGDFLEHSEPIMQRLIETQKIPMLVGGTGLYIDGLIFERNFPQVEADDTLRNQFAERTTEDLYYELLERDREYALEIHPHNRPYIERALEVKILTGKSKKDFRTPPELKYDILFLTPEIAGTTDITDETYREDLYTRINSRVEAMFSQGLEQEVKQLIDTGYTQEDF